MFICCLSYFGLIVCVSLACCWVFYVWVVYLFGLSWLFCCLPLRDYFGLSLAVAVGYLLWVFGDCVLVDLVVICLLCLICLILLWACCCWGWPIVTFCFFVLGRCVYFVLDFVVLYLIDDSMN